MLFPSSHAWTPSQKSLIVSAAVVALVLCGAGIYNYERYHPRPTYAVSLGAVHASDDSDEVFFEEVAPEHQPHWKLMPQEVDSDPNDAEWHYKFLTGSDKPLGSAADMAAIKHLLPATIPPTIRWVSRSVVVVASGCYSDRSPSRDMRCLYVFEKHGSKWKLTHHYRFSGFPALAPGSRT